MRAVVITGGKAPEPLRIAAETSAAEMVVAADSGVETALACGVRPDLVVGDFDSVSSTDLLSGFAAEEILSYPRDKDETDTEIAVRTCRERLADEIVILGGGGGQIAHFVGILSLFDRPEPPTAWITDTAEFVCITESWEITGEVGDVVGFFPLGCELCTMHSTGLRWPLDSVQWNKGDVGVSNELSETVATITMRTGRLLMIRDLEA